MTNWLPQESSPQSPVRDNEPLQVFTSASAAVWRQTKLDQGQQEDWEARHRTLQEYLCELLIKNQRLRELLALATNQRCPEFADEYD